MAHARVQPLLHPAREFGVAQQAQGRALDIVHVHPATLALEVGVGHEQHAGQAGHALVVLPSSVLAPGVAQVL